MINFSVRISRISSADSFILLSNSTQRLILDSRVGGVAWVAVIIEVGFITVTVVDINITSSYVYIHSLRGYPSRLPFAATLRGYAASQLRYLRRHEVPFAATLLRSYATCDGECGEMRDENQTTFRKNGFQNGAIEGPFDRGKVLKEQVRFQRRS
jgi:hypothetical protein